MNLDFIIYRQFIITVIIFGDHFVQANILIIIKKLNVYLLVISQEF